jgi:Concanavalin A-like lectin/glucanases superfamily
MALQFNVLGGTGNTGWNIRTPSNTATSNLPAFSVSFWIQISAQLTGTFHIIGSGIDIRTNLFGVNTIQASLSLQSLEYVAVQFAMTPGLPYFIVLTHTQGTQRGYVNSCVPIAFSSYTGNTYASNNQITIGCDSGQLTPVSIILGQLAFYHYALTGSESGPSNDIVNLLLGNMTPISSGLSGGPAAWYPPLNGVIGTSPQVGDAALNNAGTLGN